MPEFPLILGGGENKLYFALYGSRNRAGGGKGSGDFSLPQNHTFCK
ncbi:hypothetical protein LEP1GSC188_4189 [Leptospira weilii serovar Topaz str. LT2116]|uniref:Uncharacterized protein n=1 Tax=Leptospira weilii serovar Topaz str. LT2116 TaxID=1088540 RepID=M3H4K6_9LEPT|nr:hypothetical protein LEP1GSC188_4189 [Leptospira weilii serovar Topaz str. LT2116]